ncbi:MAG: patatin-like phospholipase family protein [Trueperaceae bacterium]|nr:MAG: patatin-like phospholipase family protein [Trueperaceae bacterium]
MPIPSSRLEVSHRIGVALGGGSARGYAHIGALASLERNGFAPSLIAGTSFGAVIGAMYASGRSTCEMKLEANGVRRRDVVPHVLDFGLHRAALFAGHKLESYFERLVEGRHFLDLDRQLVVVTTDVDSGERVVLREGSLARALRASTAIPGIFPPVEIDGRRLIDGGIGSPVPVETLSGFDVDLAIGIGAGITSSGSKAIRHTQRFLTSEIGQRLHRALVNTRQTSPFARLGRALAYTATSWVEPKNPEETLQVQTDPPISWLNFHKAEAAIRAGEEALERFMPQIHKALVHV